MGEVSGEKLNSILLNLRSGEEILGEVLAIPVVLDDPESGNKRAAIMLGEILVAATMSGGEAQPLNGEVETVQYWPPNLTIMHNPKDGRLHVFKCEESNRNTVYAQHPSHSV